MKTKDIISKAFADHGMLVSPDESRKKSMNFQDSKFKSVKFCGQWSGFWLWKGV